MRLFGSGDAEAGMADPVPGDEPDAVARADEPRKVEPGTAAQAMTPTTPGHKRNRRIARRPVIVLGPAILDPLQGIPKHVVKTKRVRLEAADRRCALVPRAAAAGAVRQVLTDLVAPPPRRRRAGARRVFPLRLRRQPVALPCRPRQPRNIGF